MPITSDDIRNYAFLLDQAEQARAPIRQISIAHPDMTRIDGYAIQRSWVDLKRWRSAPSPRGSNESRNFR